jgi:non-heme chloroperoxidase
MSEKPTGLEHYTQDALWADDMHAVIAGLALRKPILGGWSYGGFLINDYLAKYVVDRDGQTTGYPACGRKFQ